MMNWRRWIPLVGMTLAAVGTWPADAGPIKKWRKHVKEGIADAGRIIRQHEGHGLQNGSRLPAQQPSQQPPRGNGRMHIQPYNYKPFNFKKAVTVRKLARRTWRHRR
jgi:hypothetical protein